MRVGDAGKSLQIGKRSNNLYCSPTGQFNITATVIWGFMQTVLEYYKYNYFENLFIFHYEPTKYYIPAGMF